MYEDKPRPPDTRRSISADQRTGITVAVIFILLLIILPLLVSMGKRKSQYRDYNYAPSTSRLKFD